MVIGLHFFSPAHVMRLVEIVRGKQTEQARDRDCDGARQDAAKVGVLVGNCRGFVGNRMMLPYMREAQFLVEEGATPEQVDRALTNFGMAMGIFAVDDMGGIDLGVAREAGIRAPAKTRRARAAGAGQAVRDGPLRPEDAAGLVSLRREPQSRLPIPKCKR